MIREKGKIIKWNDEKGFGFILPNDSQKNIFVHIKSFADKRIRPSLNENVTYSVHIDKDNKTSAINVTRETDETKNYRHRNKKNITLKSIAVDINKNKNNNFKVDYKSTHKIGIFHIIFIIIFLTFLLYSFINGQIPFFIIMVYVFISIITYFVYSLDKSKAITENYRTSEKILHILSLLGGWIGALIAQQKFRHKTKKTSFQMSFWITVFLNILLLTSAFRIIHF